MQKRAEPRRAAKKRRVSGRDQSTPRGVRPGSQDWKLGLIEPHHVQTLVAARKLALPLETAAEMAGVAPDLALLWLTEGRRLLERRRAGPSARAQLAPYRQRCLDLAEGWDRAVAGTVALLRGYMLTHAKRDAKACALLLGSLERDYAERQAQRKGAPLGELVELEEALVPLELEPPRAAAAGRTTRITHKAADGSTTTLEHHDNFDDRTDEDLDHYAAHGIWPEERALPVVIDAEGELLEEDDAGAPLPEAEHVDDLAEDLAAAPTMQGQRIDPREGLRELDRAELIERIMAPPAPQELPEQPVFEPLPRIDPLAGR